LRSRYNPNSPSDVGSHIHLKKTGESLHLLLLFEELIDSVTPVKGKRAGHARGPKSSMPTCVRGVHQGEAAGRSSTTAS
jgi:hypothetical protein